MKLVFTLCAFAVTLMATPAHAGFSPHACAQAGSQFLIEKYRAMHQLDDSDVVVLHSMRRLENPRRNNIYFEGFLRLNRRFVRQEFSVILTPNCQRVSVEPVTCGLGCKKTLSARARDKAARAELLTKVSLWQPLEIR